MALGKSICRASHFDLARLTARKCCAKPVFVTKAYIPARDVNLSLVARMHSTGMKGLTFVLDKIGHSSLMGLPCSGGANGSALVGGDERNQNSWRTDVVIM